MKLTTAIVLLCVHIAIVSSRPESFLIDVPFQRQINDYTCGDASFAMVMEHWGVSLDQRAIVDVMRTSVDEGTLSFDVVRGGHFSNMSDAAAITLFPEQAPQRGWSQKHNLGFASFGHRSNQCWLDELKDVIAEGYPIIVLQYYNEDPAEGGHYRVVVGYNDSLHTITTLDPWDRDGQAPVMIYSETEFCQLWNYIEHNKDNTAYQPFFGALIAPWQITLAVKSQEPTASYLNVAPARLTADITYTCVAPFCAERPVARNVTAVATVSENLQLVSPHIVHLPDMHPGMVQHVEWSLFSTASAQDTPTEIHVTVAGVISDEVPTAYCCNNTYYPAYHYQDRIGGKAVNSNWARRL